MVNDQNAFGFRQSLCPKGDECQSESLHHQLICHSLEYSCRFSNLFSNRCYQTSITAFYKTTSKNAFQIVEYGFPCENNLQLQRDIYFTPSVSSNIEPNHAIICARINLGQLSKIKAGPLDLDQYFERAGYSCDTVYIENLARFYLRMPGQIEKWVVMISSGTTISDELDSNYYVGLIQHDQIKLEFSKHPKGLPLLVRYATDTQFDPEKVQLRALEIIMFLTFNHEAEAWLRQNNTFVQHLRTLASHQNTPDLQKAANGILWRLFSKHGKAEPKFPYDVMISYSHKDKAICHRIYNALLADKFRVWIDLEGMHGAVMQAMADAVEQSRCVLICMSENYFLSPYCQAEAQYAFEQQRHLVPIRVQAGYKADGWLGILISGRIYVDFLKIGFDAAYTQTVSEIRQNQAYRR
ncbi:unnamed protein product, partial [Rotaria sp. Silwood1]